jgi:hypothetical protein
MAPNHTRSLLPRHYIATIPAVLLFALASCQRHEQQIQTPIAEANPPASTSPDEASTAIPADFDRGMPLFPGATVEVVHKPKGSMREILMATGGSVDRVIDFYRSGLEKNGFAITSTLKVARKTWSCDFHKGDRQASVLLYPSDADKSRTTIDLMYEMPASGDERPTPPDEKFDVVGPGEVAQQTQDQNEKRSSGWHY